jgi:DNA-binding transcriptional LysR family regulator
MLSGRLLRQFIAVAEELNFRKAADRLNMAQSPLSQAIRHLEDILEVQLLVRTNRSVTLTAGGRVFLEEARTLLRQEERAIAKARIATAAESGELALGFIGSLAYDVLPRLVDNFQARCPAVRLELHELRTKDQIEALQMRRLDVGVVRLPLSDADGLSTYQLQRDHFIVALPATHRLAKARTVNLADLAPDRFVLFSRKRVPSMYMKVMTACIEAGFYPSVAYEVLEIASAIGVVASGTAVSLVPSNLRVLTHGNVVYKELAAPASDIELEAALVWRQSDNSPTLQSFLAASMVKPFKPVPPARVRRSASRPATR